MSVNEIAYPVLSDCVKVGAGRIAMYRLERIPEGGRLIAIANDQTVDHQDRGSWFWRVVEALNFLPELRGVVMEGVL